MMLVSANLAVRLSAFRSVGGFDETMMTREDRNLTFRLTRQGAICLLDSSWFVYHDMTSTLPQHLGRCYRHGVGIARELQFESTPPTGVFGRRKNGVGISGWGAFGNSFARRGSVAILMRVGGRYGFFSPLWLR